MIIREKTDLTGSKQLSETSETSEDIIESFYDAHEEYISKSELKNYPHSRSLKGIEALAKFRGISSGFKFAEGFMLVRELVD